MKKILPFLGIGLAVVLMAVVCIFVVPKILRNRTNESVYANEAYTDTFSLSQGVTLEEVYDTGEGDVVKIYQYKFRVPGNIYEVPNNMSGSFNYIASYDNTTQTVVYHENSAITDILFCLDDYFNGEVSYLTDYLPSDALKDDLVYCYQNTPDGAIATIWDTITPKYYTFVPMDEACLVIESPEQLYFTNDAETAVFSNPADDPMTIHTYNMYEVTAIENTRNELTDGASYGSTAGLVQGVSGAEADYAGKSDNDTRKQMLNYATFNWKEDGTADGTSMVMDLTSATAKASEWIFTSSAPYSFTDNGLKLHTLVATRSAETLNITGKVTNQLPSERPYVVVIKFINNESKLLDVGVIDKRGNPIEANGLSEWSYTLNIDSGVDPQDIYGVQFEIY